MLFQNVWTDTTLENGLWDPSSNKYTLKLQQDQISREITTSRVVLALGGGGQTPEMPSYPNRVLPLIPPQTPGPNKQAGPLQRHRSPLSTLHKPVLFPRKARNRNRSREYRSRYRRGYAGRWPRLRDNGAAVSDLYFPSPRYPPLSFYAKINRCPPRRVSQRSPLARLQCPDSNLHVRQPLLVASLPDPRRPLRRRIQTSCINGTRTLQCSRESRIQAGARR